MPAAVETYNEMAAFASLRTPAWHNLGTVFSEPVTTKEMLDLAHLSDWNVRLEDIILPAKSFRNYFATVRTNPFTSENEVLGVVKERYNPFQNEDLFAFGEGLLKDGRWETAGSIKNGTVVFGALALDHDIVIDPTGVEDKVSMYLLVHTSHDGSLSIQASMTPVRVVCANTLAVAVAGAKQTYKVRHTAGSAPKIEEAYKVLAEGHKYAEKFNGLANDLFQIKVTQDTFDAIIAAAYPMPDEDSKGSYTKWFNKRDALFDIFNGPTSVGVNDNAWGAYNALTERLDWFRNPRGGDAENAYAAASGFDAATSAEKARLLKVTKDVALALV